MNGRRVFEQVSAALATVRPEAEGCNRVLDNRIGWLRAVEAVADTFASMNQAFDRPRFIADCTGETPIRGPELYEVAVARVMSHAARFGRDRTEALLLEAGAPYYSPTLARVPVGNLPYLSNKLRKELES